MPSNGHNVPSRLKKQLEWSVRSGRDLPAIDACIAADNPVVAEQVVDYIIGQAEQLTRFPLLGRIPKTGGSPTLSQSDRQAFANQLDKFLAKN